MASADKPTIGSIAWMDLTVENAAEIRDFYSEVVGWTTGNVDMGGYDDFNMTEPGTDNAVVGVCHARGGNADMPAVWLSYVIVADLDHSIERCASLGGSVVAGPKLMGGHGRYCVIKDPAGAQLALFEPLSS